MQKILNEIEQLENRMASDTAEEIYGILENLISMAGFMWMATVLIDVAMR